MVIPQSIIRKIDLELGATGIPHMIDHELGARIDTGCHVWSLPRDSEGPMGFALKYDSLLRKYHEAVREAQSAAADEALMQLRELTSSVKQTKIHGMSVIEMRDVTPADPKYAVNRHLWRIRAILGNNSLVAYRTKLQWCTYDLAIADALVIAPAASQFEILRIEGVAGYNFGVDTDAIIEKLSEIDQAFGVDIVGAGRGDVVEFLIKRIPKGREATALGKLLFKLCPSIGEAPKRFAKGRIALMWD